jgi:16S rRNA (guanine527-N7)-methyltransferase
VSVDSHAGVEQQLDEGLPQLGLSLSAHARGQLLRYLVLLQKWNRVYNLTAIRQAGRLVSHHLLDSLSALPHLSGPRVIDVGSGAGLPGIPLAIARPDWQVMLLDSNHKKGAFLRQALIELELPNAQVAITRAEEWCSTQLGTTAVSRAFSDLAGFVEASRHMVLPGGILAAMKGVYPHEELAQLPAGVLVDGVVPLQVPELGAARHLVLLRVAEAGP